VGLRSNARESALKTLYNRDMTGENIKDVMESTSIDLKIPRSMIEFYETIVQGADENTCDIDALIDKYAENWSIKRITVIDKNILRLGIFEMCYLKDTPYKVVIDEAVKLAKRFGSELSGAFVNGILDRAAKEESLS